MFSKNYIFTGKVNVGVAVGAALATLLVVVVRYWLPKFKSKENGISHQLWVTSASGFTLCVFTYILNLNKKIHCFARKFISLINEKSRMLHMLKMCLDFSLFIVTNRSFSVWLSRILKYNVSMTYVTQNFWYEFWSTNKRRKKKFQWFSSKSRISEDLVFQSKSYNNWMLASPQYLMCMIIS